MQRGKPSLASVFFVPLATLLLIASSTFLIRGISSTGDSMFLAFIPLEAAFRLETLKIMWASSNDGFLLWHMCAY